MTLLELNYQRRQARRAAKELLDSAVKERRTLNIPETVQFDSLAARIAELDDEILRRESLRKLVG
jgi:cytochrome P450